MITNNQPFRQVGFGLLLAVLLATDIARAQAPAGGGGGFGGRGASSAAAVNTRVLAVADERSNSLIIAASDDMMTMISNLVEQVDQPVNDITAVRVFRLVNADPVEMADLIASLFPDETRTNTGNNNQQFQFLGGRGGGGGFFG